VKFLEQCQNFSEGELDPEWRQALDMKGFKIGDDGGFFYKPDVDNVENYAGARTDNDGKKIINSYGSMTYAGLKTYLYAGLSKDDARVKGAVQWIRHHYSLDRHPGFPFEQDTPGRKRKDQQGLYYYYMTMALALEAWGEKPFVTSDGVKHDWPRELARKLIELQENDGSWFNDQVRWWEGDKQLVTPYALKMYAILSKHF
jgi:squalene-hopene/tetraprenyl-beta-curcumene cyclase